MKRRSIDIKSYGRMFHNSEGGSETARKAREALKADKYSLPTIPQVPPPIVWREGYVYYATDGQDRVKIGFSANPWSRVAEQRTFNPDIKLLATEKGSQLTERERQEQFKSDHLVLEWFKMSDALKAHIAYIMPAG